MARPLIQDVNAKVTRNQDTKIRVRMVPAVDITNWDNFGVTFRKDPLYPRTTGEDVAAARSGDLDVSTWEATVTSLDVSKEDEANGVFDLTIPASDMLLLSEGTNRYVIDVWRTDGGTQWQLVPLTWVSVSDYAHQA